MNSAIRQLLSRMRFGAERRHRYFAFWLLAVVASVGPGWFWTRAGTAVAALDACTVSSVHDGDTLRVKCAGEISKIRLHCIDTPEMAQKPWGRESRDHLHSLAPSGAAVAVRRHDKDRYGRIVGEVSVAGDNLNLKMVADGQAAVYPKYCRDDRYYQAQTQAKAAGSGIWSREGLHQTPWDYRKSTR